LNKPRPLAAFAVPSARIVASPIKYGWRYQVMPAGRAQVVPYCLRRARDTAALYSKRIIEIGPPAAFGRKAGK
jgi:hypothetical protein